MYPSIGSPAMSAAPALGVAAVIIAIILTVLVLVLVVPEKKRAGLPKFFQAVHDICNFKGLLLEKVLKVLYIFNTLFVMLSGIFTWFSGGNFGINFLIGLLILVLGPILVRLVYEFMMLFILVVKNVIQINNKLNGKNDNPFVNNIDFDKFNNFNNFNDANAPQQNFTSPYAQPVQPEQPVVQNDYQPQPQSEGVKFCTGCGTQVTESTEVCPHCGKHLN